jgi:hypothetical protein
MADQGVKVHVEEVFFETIGELTIDLRKLLFKKEIYIREYKIK